MNSISLTGVAVFLCGCKRTLRIGDGVRLSGQASHVLRNHIGLGRKHLLRVHIPGGHLGIVARKGLAPQQLLVLLHQVEVQIQLCFNIRRALVVLIVVLVRKHLQVPLAERVAVGHQGHRCRISGIHLMSLPSQSLLLDLAQDILWLCLLMYCSLVSKRKIPILHGLCSLLHLKGPCVEALASSMSIEPLQCRRRETGNLRRLEGCRGRDLSAVLPLPFLEVASM